MAEKKGENDLIGTVEAAALTGLAVRTLAQHAALGHIPGARQIGGVWLFERAAIIAFKPARRGRPKKEEEPPPVKKKGGKR